VRLLQDWTFPRDLPEIWTRYARVQRTISNTTPQSNLTSAIRQRDITCRITAFESGTEVVHLIPEHERRWFLSNSMTEWNSDLTLDPPIPCPWLTPLVVQAARRRDRCLFPTSTLFREPMPPSCRELILWRMLDVRVWYEDVAFSLPKRCFLQSWRVLTEFISHNFLVVPSIPTCQHAWYGLVLRFPCEFPSTTCAEPEKHVEKGFCLRMLDASGVRQTT
jgi:hypothetical protein